jgi:hypothetical protein
MRVMVTLLYVVAVSGVTAADRRIIFELQPDSLAIHVDNQPLATYVYRDSQILRPYFKDIYAPGGVRVTRRHPPREGVDPVDHATMHPGLWLAFGDLGGADFWRNKATVEHAGFVKAPQAEGDSGTFTVRNRYVAGGTAICEETCTYTFQVRPAGCLILWDSTFQSERSGFYFGDQEEMGLGVRVATPIMVKPLENRSPHGRIVDDNGRMNEKAIWGQQAAWCDYSGSVNDTFAGIMVMPDPRNTTACRWHVRDYGLMVANPFGQSVFKKGPAKRTEVTAGQPLRLQFGILVHATAGGENFDPAAAYQDYLKTTMDAAKSPAPPLAEHPLEAMQDAVTRQFDRSRRGGSQPLQ